MDKKNIIFNHTLEQYNKKYRNRNYRLLKMTKKELDDFCKFNNTNKEFLLGSKKWWLINDTYYEIPKPIRFTWFRNLNAGVKTGICLLGVGVVTTAITLPLVLLRGDTPVTPIEKPEIIIDPMEETNVTIEKVESDNKYTYVSLKCKIDTDEIISVKVKKGDTDLEQDKEFTFNKSEQKVLITNEAINKHQGKLVITPKTEEKQIEGIQLSKNSFNLAVDSSFILTVTKNTSGEEVKFESSNPEVATVGSVYGDITVKGIIASENPVTITATAGKYTATCIVKVLSKDKYLTVEGGDHNIDIVNPDGGSLPTFKNQSGEIVEPDSIKVDNTKVVTIKNNKIVSTLTDRPGETALTISKEGYPDIDFPVFVGSFDKITIELGAGGAGSIQSSDKSEGEIIFPNRFYFDNKIRPTYYIWKFKNKKLTSIYIPPLVQDISSSTFMHDDPSTSTLTNVIIDNKGKQITLNHDCFNNNALLSEFKVTKGTVLDQFSFYSHHFGGCTNLKTVVIDESDIATNYNDYINTELLNNATTVKVLNTITLEDSNYIKTNFPNVSHEKDYDVYTK